MESFKAQCLIEQLFKLCSANQTESLRILSQWAANYRRLKAKMSSKLMEIYALSTHFLMLRKNHENLNWCQAIYSLQLVRKAVLTKRRQMFENGDLPSGRINSTEQCFTSLGSFPIKRQTLIEKLTRSPLPMLAILESKTSSMPILRAGLRSKLVDFTSSGLAQMTDRG